MLSLYLPPENMRLDNRELVSQSVTRHAYINTSVNNIPTTFIRTESGMFFRITVPREELARICSRISALILVKTRPLGGRVAVGELNEKGSWPLADRDEELALFVSQAAKHFSVLVDNFRGWATFHQFLKTEIDFDAKMMPVDMQLPIDYWWLVGKLKDERPLLKTNLYNDAGIFIRPDDHRLPAFSSSFYADMAGQYYSRKYSLPLVPVHIQCLPCYLSGIGGFVGSEAIKAALLDEQWGIRFVTCAEQQYSAPSHFYISDVDGEEYALTGCHENESKPRWEIRRWGHDEQLFPKKCAPLPWSITDKFGK